MTADPFSALCIELGVTPDRRGEAHIPCPACAHRVVPGQTHFSFNDRGGHCFVCGASYSLFRLALDLRVEPHRMTLTAAQRPVVRVAPPRDWEVHSEDYQRRYAAASDSALNLWRARVGRLTPDQATRYELGMGTLPSTACQHVRLTYPLRRDGRIIALRGRRIDCDCLAKWINSAGSKMWLWGANDLLRARGRHLIVTESPVSAIAAMTYWEPYLIQAVAYVSASLWRSEYAGLIAAAQPDRVTVWPDCDPVGIAAGVRAQHDLAEAGVNARIWRWAPGSVEHFDLADWVRMKLAFKVDYERSSPYPVLRPGDPGHAPPTGPN